MKQVQRAAFFTAALAVAFALPIAAHASTRRHDVADANYLALGAQYESVGGVQVGSSFGSATLIGGNWILTAAHVVGTNTSGSFFLNGNTYNVTGIVRHPNWPGGGPVGTNPWDFALGFISSGVAGVTPSGYYAGDDELGEVGTSVGFGRLGTGITGDINGNDGFKRGFTNVIDGRDVQAGLLGLLADFDNPAGTTNTLGPIGSSPSPTGLEGCVTPGDSGGGLFVDFFGQDLLVGVSSYVAQANFNSGSLGKYGDASGWADTSRGASWIEQVTGIAPVNPVPEPATMAALGLGALALLRKRRR